MHILYNLCGVLHSDFFPFFLVYYDTHRVEKAMYRVGSDYEIALISMTSFFPCSTKFPRIFFSFTSDRFTI